MHELVDVIIVCLPSCKVRTVHRRDETGVSEDILVSEVRREQKKNLFDGSGQIFRALFPSVRFLTYPTVV